MSQPLGGTDCNMVRRRELTVDKSQDTVCRRVVAAAVEDFGRHGEVVASLDVLAIGCVAECRYGAAKADALFAPAGNERVVTRHPPRATAGDVICGSLL